MSKTTNYVAFDLGAESGRAVVGQFDGHKLTLSELHRFANGPTNILGNLHWDAMRLFAEIKVGLQKYVAAYGTELAGIGVDTWGVDAALIGADGELLGNPYHYRDARTDGIPEQAFERVSRQEIFDRTGIQFMQINTIYQLFSMVLKQSPLLDMADKLLMMPDLFNYWLTGRQVCEFSEATTSQLYDPRRKGWALPLFEKLGIPTHFLAEIVPPGTVLGPLHPSVQAESGLGDVPVIAPATHDTGSAVAAVPATGRNHAYISSGTWSLAGIETEEPIITAESLAYNFTNEGGVCDTIRFLKNIMGLWLVQECRRTWASQGDAYSYDELTAMAAEAAPFQSLLDPDDASFLHPGDMPSCIQAFCQRTGQPVPESRGAIVRCALESLACTYRWTIESLEKVVDRTIDTIHIVGGGARNKLLNQFAADATGRPIVAGPFEATAIGNILMQALATGHIASLDQGREIVRRSFDVSAYDPQNAAQWDEPYARYLRVTKANQGN